MARVLKRAGAADVAVLTLARVVPAGVLARDFQAGAVGSI